MWFKDLVGYHYLSGVDMGYTRIKGHWDWETAVEVAACRFVLDNVVIEAVEDPSDGYRSLLGTIEILKDKQVANTFNPILVEARLGDEEDDNGNKQELLEFYDAKNDKLVLRMGTCRTDDYYPYCVLEFIPQNMSINEGQVLS